MVGLSKITVNPELILTLELDLETPAIVAFLVVDIGVHSSERNCGTKYQKAIKTADHVASTTSEADIKEVIAKFKLFFWYR